MARTKNPSYDKNYVPPTEVTSTEPVEVPLTRNKRRVLSESAQGNLPATEPQADSYRALSFGPRPRVIKRFDSPHHAQRFFEKFADVEVAIERKFEVDLFVDDSEDSTIPTRVLRWVNAKFWKNLVGEHPALPDLVREFYCFAREYDADDDYPNRFFSRVRGIDCTITAESFNSYLVVADVPTPQYPYSEGSMPGLDTVLSELLGYPRSWGSVKSVNLGYLHKDYRLLYKIFHSCMRPDTHVSLVTQQSAYILYAIGTGARLDIGDLLFDLLKSSVKSLRGINTPAKMKLPFAGKITGILLSMFDVPRLSEEFFAPPKKPFNHASWHQSLARSPLVKPNNDDLSKDPFYIYSQGNTVGSKGKSIEGEDLRRARMLQASGSRGTQGDQIVDDTHAKLEEIDRDVKQLKEEMFVMREDLSSIRTVFGSTSELVVKIYDSMCSGVPLPPRST